MKSMELPSPLIEAVRLWIDLNYKNAETGERGEILKDLNTSVAAHFKIQHHEACYLTRAVGIKRVKRSGNYVSSREILHGAQLLVRKLDN